MSKTFLISLKEAPRGIRLAALAFFVALISAIIGFVSLTMDFKWIAQVSFIVIVASVVIGICGVLLRLYDIVFSPRRAD